MKIIDLLNKIANGEELKFKLKDEDSTYSIKKGNYLRIEELNKDAEWYIDESWLNEEAEILDEEDKDIPLIPDDELYDFDNPRFYFESQLKQEVKLDYNFKVLQEKINQIVKKINEEGK